MSYLNHIRQKELILRDLRIAIKRQCKMIKKFSVRSTNDGFIIAIFDHFAPFFLAEKSVIRYIHDLGAEQYPHLIVKIDTMEELDEIVREENRRKNRQIQIL